MKRKLCSSLVLLFLSITSNAQHFTVTMANLTTPTASTLEVDIMLIVDTPVGLAQVSVGINYNTAILNGGLPCTAVECGSWDYIHGTTDAALQALSPTVNTTRGPASFPTYGHLRTVGTALSGANAPDIPQGTFRIGRFRFTNTTNWAANTNAELWLQDTNINGATNTVVSFYPSGAVTPLNNYTTTNPAAGAGLTLGYTQSSPLNRILNPGLGIAENDPNPLQVYPNPFADNFNLSFETVSNDPVNVKVYDMIGKLIDNQTIEASVVNTIQLGNNYQSGIYNVSVSQGNKMQHARIIKN